MKELIYQDLPIDQREEAIFAESFEQIDLYEYERVLSDLDIQERQGTFAEIHIEWQKVEAEKAAAMAVFNKRLAEIKTRSANVLEEIRDRRTVEVGTVYRIADPTFARIRTYNRHGEEITSRPMNRDERETFGADGTFARRQPEHVAALAN